MRIEEKELLKMTGVISVALGVILGLLGIMNISGCSSAGPNVYLNHTIVYLKDKRYKNCVGIIVGNYKNLWYNVTLMKHDMEFIRGPL